MAECEVSSSNAKGEEGAAQEDATSLVWMSAENQAVRRSQITSEEIEKLTVTCSSCGHQLNHHCSGELRIHRVLQVLVCKRCYSYYGDGDFKKDDTGVDEYCSWCAEGGNLIVCDSCTRAFCKKCVHRNLSRRELRRIASLKEWKCYVCDPAPLAPMVNYANMVKKYSEDVGNKAAQQGPTPIKMSEAELKRLALEKAELIQQSVAELARGEGNLATVSKMLRDHARTLARIAQGAEDCEKRQLRSRRKAEEKEVKDSCPDSPASADSQSKRTKRRTRNKKPVAAPDPECVVLSEPDEDNGEEMDQGEQASGGERGGDSEAAGSASTADVGRGKIAGPSAKMVNGETSGSGAKDDARRASEEVGGSAAKLVAGVGKEKKAEAAPATLEVPPVLSLGDEFSPLPPNGESENESESLLADLYTSGANTTDEIVPETPPHKEQLKKAVDKEKLVSKDQDKQTKEALDADDAANPGAALDAAPGISELVENSEGPSAGEGDGQRAVKIGIVDSAAENNDRSTETVPSSHEDDDNEPHTPQGTANPRKKKRTPLSKNEKARRALMRSLRYSGESSSDDEFPDLSQSPRTHKPPKKDVARKRKRTSSSSSVLIAECIEKAVEEFNDPKLKMNLAVSLVRLPIDSSEIPMEGVEALPSVDDSEDKEIAKLLTIPKKSRKTAKEEEEESPGTKSKKGSVPRKAKTSKKKGSDNSNVDSEQDDDMQEENDDVKDESTPVKTKKIPKLKEDLMQNILHSSSEQSSGGEDSASLKKKKPKKKASEGKESDKESDKERRAAS